MSINAWEQSDLISISNCVKGVVFFIFIYLLFYNVFTIRFYLILFRFHHNISAALVYAKCFLAVCLHNSLRSL